MVSLTNTEKTNKWAMKFIGMIEEAVNKDGRMVGLKLKSRKRDEYRVLKSNLRDVIGFCQV